MGYFIKPILKMKMSLCRYALFKDVFTIVPQVNRLPDTPLIIIIIIIQ